MLKEYEEECSDIRYCEAMYKIISEIKISIVEKSTRKNFSTNLEFHYPQYREITYVGRSYCDLNDSETGGDFKLHTKMMLEIVFTKEFLDKHEMGIYEDAWYNG